MPNAKVVEFRASFPPIQSAIKIAGDGGARIQLDIPESDIENAQGLLAMRGKVVRVLMAVDMGVPLVEEGMDAE